MTHEHAFAVISAGFTLATFGWVSAQDSFTDHGIGAAAAELRSVVTTQTRDGRCLILSSATDKGKTGFLLVTDIDSGETRQIYCPEDVVQVDPFGAIMASNGKYYHTQGKVLLEFDPATCEWTFHGQPSKTVSVYLCFTEGPDGVLWAGGVYQTQLISFDPNTREMKDHGRMDPKEAYLQLLAVDKAGWVYAGIGTARCNLVAYNPKTGEKHLLVPEEKRTHGSGAVYPLQDGTVEGIAAGQHYRLFEGKAEPVEKKDLAPRRDVGAVKYGFRQRSFPDGRQIVFYDFSAKTIRVEDPKTKQTKTITFDYQTEGAAITSLGAGPDGVVYGSTAHPMHFLALNTNDGRLKDFGHIPQVGGGNFCAIASQGNHVIGAQYAAGCLWAYDVTKPWYLGQKRVLLANSATELAQSGTIAAGHLSYLQGHDIVFIHGNEWGAEAHFPVQAAKDGAYWLYIAPYRHHNYCTVQFLFDGNPVAEPYAATGTSTGPGEMHVVGPLELTAGAHRFTVRMLATDGEGIRPFFGLRGIDLSPEQRQIESFEEEPNPRVLAQWSRDVCRPRTALAHPDGKHVMMAGFAGYGLCGGGIGIYNLETSEETLLTADKELLPGHACITLDALPNGNLVGGTSISAPGGGHVTAKEAELFILDWETKKVTHHFAPVPGDSNVISLKAHANGRVYGLSGNSTFFVFDPETRLILHSESYREYGRVPRHALQIGPDGRLYAMMSNAILAIDPASYNHEKLADSPVNITAGGALVNGLLCFAHNSRVWTYRLPE